MTPTELDEQIPLGHLLPQHLLRCRDDVYRKVTKIDYLFDMNTLKTSLEQAAVSCEGGYQELVNHHAYIYTGVLNRPEDKPKKTGRKKDAQSKQLRHRGTDTASSTQRTVEEPASGAEDQCDKHEGGDPSNT